MREMVVSMPLGVTHSRRLGTVGRLLNPLLEGVEVCDGGPPLEKPCDRPPELQQRECRPGHSGELERDLIVGSMPDLEGLDDRARVGREVWRT